LGGHLDVRIHRLPGGVRADFLELLADTDLPGLQLLLFRVGPALKLLLPFPEALLPQVEHLFRVRLG